MAPPDRDAILRRRAQFVAAALASAGVIAGAEGCAKKEAPAATPPVTTTYVPEADAGPSVEDPDAELVTTEIEPPRPEDAGSPPEEVPPAVCLSPAICLSPPRPPPQPCLSVPPPNPKPTKPRICLDFNP